MPVTIGAKKESDFSDPLGMLGDCHRRIERFLAVLVAVTAREKGGALSDQRRNELSTALTYFRDAAPRHTADEEESLFPRLRQSPDAGVREALARLDRLEHDHARAARAQDEVDRLGRQWLTAGELPPEDAARLASVLGELAELYREHIALEDTGIFPLAASVLPPSERASIGAEMAARRGVK